MICQAARLYNNIILNSFRMNLKAGQLVKTRYLCGAINLRTHEDIVGRYNITELPNKTYEIKEVSSSYCHLGIQCKPGYSIWANKSEVFPADWSEHDM